MTPAEIREKQSHKGTAHPRWKGGDPAEKKQKRYYYRFRERNLEREKKYYQSVKKEQHQELRKKALLLAGNGELMCGRCGCDVFTLLEINHINGIGSLQGQIKYRAGLSLWNGIVRGELPLTDFNVLCKVCNIIHYVKLNYGQDNYTIKWKQQK